MSNTVRLHRVLRSTPEKVYRAFLDPDAYARWLPPDGFTGKVHEMDARVGGGFRMSFTNFTAGNSHFFRGRYVELVPGKRIVHIDTFEDPLPPGDMTVTIELKAVSVGTEISIEQSGIPDMIPLDACYHGWQESLASLARLVEPDIQEG